jgi:dihydroflavonol-4-reductase
MEDQVLEAARRGLPAVVLNPTMCLGPWDAKPRHLCLVPRLLAGEVISSVDHVVNVIDVRDVARVLVAALDGGRFGEPILASGFNISVEDLCREICALGNARPPTVRTPTQVALAVAYWSEYWLAMVGQKASYPSLSMLLLTQFTALPPNPTLAELGVSLRPLAATIGDSITWFRSLGYC